MPYAAATDVSIDRSKHQLEAMLRQRGCEGFASAWSATGDDGATEGLGLTRHAEPLRFTNVPLATRSYR